MAEETIPNETEKTKNLPVKAVETDRFLLKALKVFHSALASKKFEDLDLGEDVKYTDLVSPDIHLDSKAFSLFRKYVMSKKCRCRRRIATNADKKKFKISRSGTHYFITIHIPAEAVLANEKAEEKKVKKLETIDEVEMEG